MATRRVLFDPADPTNVETDHRQREVAAILAADVIRMLEKSRAARAPRARAGDGPHHARAGGAGMQVSDVTGISGRATGTRLCFGICGARWTIVGCA